MVEAEVLTALLSGSPTLAGGRVYGGGVIGDDEVMPAVSYQRVSTIAVNSLLGHSRLDHARVQVDCWADTYHEAKQTATEARLLMQAAGFKALLANEFDEYEPDTGRYRVSSDYMVWQRS